MGAGVGYVETVGMVEIEGELVGFEVAVGVPDVGMLEIDGSSDGIAETEGTALGYSDGPFEGIDETKAQDKHNSEMRRTSKRNDNWI